MATHVKYSQKLLKLMAWTLTFHWSADQNQHQRGGVGTSWEHQKAPSELQALDGLEEIEGLLRPCRDGPQKRYKESPLKAWGKRVLQDVKVFLNLFTAKNSKVKGEWMAASKQAVSALGKPTKHTSRKLCKEAKKFLTQKQVPQSPYGAWNQSRIDTNKEFAQEINLYLQSKGKYVKSDDISVYLSKPEVQEKWGLKKLIGRATCKRLFFSQHGTSFNLKCALGPKMVKKKTYIFLLVSSHLFHGTAMKVYFTGMINVNPNGFKLMLLQLHMPKVKGLQ
ncbi:hypothetical protein B0H34DRAFT_678049 [Crassisporium funariophilum]|nr:hypothetical protein B0H34DRAFT_678049 [Crassisporium funariophilum]